MALTQITYNDKSNYQSSALADEYKVTDDDMNEIKSVVNDAVSQLDNSITRSSSEKIIGFWTDGKPIYRQVMSFGNLPNNSIRQVAHNISIDTPIQVYGYVYNSDTNAKFTMPWAGLNVTLDQTYVTITTTSDRSSWVGYVVIEYTKTS